MNKIHKFSGDKWMKMELVYEVFAFKKGVVLV